MLFFIFTINDTVRAEKEVANQPITIALDPGHGGDEDGAYYYGIKEKDINLEVAHFLKAELENYPNVTVILTRSEDEEVNLYERARRASELKADILLSLHFNASARFANGASVYISTAEGSRADLQDLADNLLGEFEAIGLENAGTFSRVTQMNGRREDGSFDDYYGVLRHSYNMGMPSMIIEHCFLDSVKDKEYFGSTEGLKKLAKADANAIAAHYELVDTDGNKVTPKHGTVYGATSKAVKENYFDAPNVTVVKLLEYDGSTPGLATYEVSVEDEIGVTSVYLVYKNSAGGSVTVPLQFDKALTTGTYQAKAYIPEFLGTGGYTLSFVGAYNRVGFDAGYNRAGNSMVGFGKCEWLNSFAYFGEADLQIEKEGSISTAHAKLMDYEIEMGLRDKRNRYSMRVYPN